MDAVGRSGVPPLFRHFVRGMFRPPALDCEPGERQCSRSNYRPWACVLLYLFIRRWRRSLSFRLRCRTASRLVNPHPMPIWTPEIRHDGKLSSEPPAGNGRLVYIDLLAENEDVHCAKALDNEYYTFIAPGRENVADLEVMDVRVDRRPSN